MYYFMSYFIAFQNCAQVFFFSVHESQKIAITLRAQTLLGKCKLAHIDSESSESFNSLSTETSIR